MPRSLDPDSILTMVLACDVDKPKETQPRIFAKSPTLNQQRKLIAMLSSLQSGNMADKIDLILDAATMLLTGWENIPFPFSREAIGDVLNLDEIVEVLSFLVSSTQLTADDKKKSESQP